MADKTEQQPEATTPPVTPVVEQQNQPAPTNATPNVNVLELLKQTTDAQRDEIERLRKRAEDAEKAASKQTEPQLTPEQERAAYFDSPAQMIRKQIEATVSPMLQPIIQTFQQQKQVSDYDRAKNSLKQKLGERFAEVEHVVDDLARRFNLEPNEANLTGLYWTARGMLTEGVVQPKAGFTPTQPTIPQQPTNPQQAAPIVTPPHLRPTAPAAPVGSDNKPKRRALTESERAVARINKLSDEQYLDLMEGPAQVDGIRNILKVETK